MTWRKIRAMADSWLFFSIYFLWILMAEHKTIAIILAAGKGTRMVSKLPKVMHPVANQPMIGHVLTATAKLMPSKTFVIVGPGMSEVSSFVKPHKTVLQEKRLGTADAVKTAMPMIADTEAETVLILYGDTPLIRPGTLQKMLQVRSSGATLVVLGFRPNHPGSYGRLKLNKEGCLEAIIEANEATAAELEIGLCNSGVMAVDASKLGVLLAEVGNDNTKGEYYLTDIVALARLRGMECGVVEASAEELIGVDDRAALAEAEYTWQTARRTRAMQEGVTLCDPGTVWFSSDTDIGKDVVIGPNVVFGPGVSIADNVEVRAFSHLEGVRIEEDVTVGPFVRLRPGAVLKKGSMVGNFVEVKNSVLDKGSKAAHLSYIGDADIGEKTNIGAGTITCNYDGFNKNRTVIGKSAFIGSNTALVAPINIGDGAVVGAGSAIEADVAKDALALSRAKQINLPGRAHALRKKLVTQKTSIKNQKKSED